MEMETITSDLKVRILQGDSSITRNFKIRKLSDGTVVLDDGTRRIVQRPEFHPDRFQAPQAPREQQFKAVATFRSVIQSFITISINIIAAQIPGWFAVQLKTGALSHFNG
jgi:hypothetical protein